MIQNMFNLCKLGGRVAGLLVSCDLRADSAKKLTKYDITYECDDTYFRVNGAEYLVKCGGYEGRTLAFPLHWYSKDHYQKTFEKVGFVNFRWVSVFVDGDDEDLEYYQDFIENSHLLYLEAFKPKHN